MNQNKLFNLTQWRLAGWYTGVMSLILSLCAIGLYEAIAHAHWVALNRELESVAGTLHDSIEPTLKYPSRLEPATQQLLPDLCLVDTNCVTTITQPRHVLGAIHQGDYYVRLLNRSGKIIAKAGLQPEKAEREKSANFCLLPSFPGSAWERFCLFKGARYQQISLSLHTRDNQEWGYIQVGRSLQDFDDYMAALRLILLLGLPIAMLLVGGASWWLAARAMQPVYGAYAQMQQFTADAAHELRTPLAAIQATVESARRSDRLPEHEGKEILAVMERQTRRLSQLVQDLLLLARMDRQTLPLTRLSCCLNDIVSDLVEEFAALAIAGDVMLTTNIRVAKPVYVTGNEEQLYRLVSNLIVNAIHYTPAGGKVNVILDSSSHQALIQIVDTGVGIAVEEQTRIFDRFYRVNSDRSRHTGGSGLGLPIAQAIATAHGGSLQVQSQLGNGSTFTLRLPLR